jgi:formamidopyrimidine-DNA glycosylase
MPELPEVETTLRGIKPYIILQKIKQISVRQYQLRWPIMPEINHKTKKKIIQAVERRGKYLLLKMRGGALILHLGMSGSLRILTDPVLPGKHDHVDIELENNILLRFNDPRRFGALLWTKGNPLQHPLLAELGPEPLTPQFSARYLWQRAQQRKTAIKLLIMDSKIVVGIGNIYANEILFAAGISPFAAAEQISLKHCQRLVQCIKKILRAAILQGGTTLKNFANCEGKPGYFKLHLKAYGRTGLPCIACKTLLKEARLGQRSTVYCPQCQASPIK